MPPAAPAPASSPPPADREARALVVALELLRRSVSDSAAHTLTNTARGRTPPDWAREMAPPPPAGGPGGTGGGPLGVVIVGPRPLKVEVVSGGGSPPPPPPPQDPVAALVAEIRALADHARSLGQTNDELAAAIAKASASYGGSVRGQAREAITGERHHTDESLAKALLTDKAPAFDRPQAVVLVGPSPVPVTIAGGLPDTGGKGPADPKGKPPPRPKKSGGSGAGAIATALAGRFAMVLGPLAALSTVLGQTNSGMSVFQKSVSVLGATLAPVLLPVFAVLATAVLSVSDAIWQKLLPKLGDWFQLVLEKGIPAVEKLVEAFLAAADKIGEGTGLIQQAWDEWTDFNPTEMELKHAPVDYLTKVKDLPLGRQHIQEQEGRLADKVREIEGHLDRLKDGDPQAESIRGSAGQDKLDEFRAGWQQQLEAARRQQEEFAAKLRQAGIATAGQRQLQGKAETPEGRKQILAEYGALTAEIARHERGLRAIDDQEKAGHLTKDQADQHRAAWRAGLADAHRRRHEFEAGFGGNADKAGEQLRGGTVPPVLGRGGGASAPAEDSFLGRVGRLAQAVGPKSPAQLARDNLRDVVQSLARSLGPQASFGSAAGRASAVQLAALNQDPIEAKMLQRMIESVGLLGQISGKLGQRPDPRYPGQKPE